MKKAQCSFCKEFKDEEKDFYRSKGKRQYRCKKCMIDYGTAWNKKHRDRIKALCDDYLKDLASRKGKKDDL